MPKKKRIDPTRLICWIIIPIVLIAVIVVDALGIYCLSETNLNVVGLGSAMLLLPLFGEIKLKDLTVKRDRDSSDDDKKQK